jgi:hypothetical protein
MSDKKKTKDVTVDETQKSTETVVKKELYWETISLSAIITHF